MDKSRILYSWIGSNIEYDYDRAEKALNNEKVEDSGAISAFKKEVVFVLIILVFMLLWLGL